MLEDLCREKLSELFQAVLEPRSMPRSNAFDANAGRVKRSKAIAMATTDHARSHRTADGSRCVARAYVVPLSNQKRCLHIGVDCEASINP